MAYQTVNDNALHFMKDKFIKAARTKIAFPFFTSSNIKDSDDEKISFLDKIKRFGVKKKQANKLTPLAFMKNKSYEIEHKNNQILYFKRNDKVASFCQEQDTFSVAAHIDPAEAAKKMLAFAEEIGLQKYYVNGTNEIKKAILDRYVDSYTPASKPLKFTGKDAKEFNHKLKEMLTQKAEYEASLEQRITYGD